MESNELKYLWASPENALAPEKARGLAVAALEQVNRERRRRRAMLAYLFVMMPAMTVFAAWQFMRKGVGWGESWPAMLILAAQWFTGLYLLRSFRREPAATLAEQPIRQTLELLLARTQTRCRELQAVLGLFLVAAPFVGVAIFQLQANGKMRPHEAASASFAFATILLCVGGGILFDLLARKLPERRHLETLVGEYR